MFILKVVDCYNFVAPVVSYMLSTFALFYIAVLILARRRQSTSRLITIKPMSAIHANDSITKFLGLIPFPIRISSSFSLFSRYRSYVLCVRLVF
jgi:hypothetical protein